jgi:hypothetical protein
MPPELFAPLAVICAGAILFQYHRINRLMPGIGWALIILSIGGFGSGLAASFAWSGLVFLFIGGLGVIAIAQDYLFRRYGNRSRTTPDNR